MTRVKKGVRALKRRKNILSRAKGYRFGRSTKVRQAKEALVHAESYAFDHRRDKKTDRRRLWQVKINAEIRKYDLSYSKFINMLKKKNIELDRKILADLAQNEKEVFAEIVKQAK
ncbi:50S ribosomal protein L20 [Candidatus Nomurabacteria bacterium]|nr:50S ribosomal protein L20 [Candidatus Nomurabacteria bacterium]MCB9820326.1 50S ribosomal protein L20 [Candidatus Nomurabacteria bacterium]